MSKPPGRVVCLTGGIGGAKLVLGLQAALDPARVTAVVNTGDDFRHLGFWISPDIDTLLYTLSDRANTTLGWGRKSESWGFMAALRELGGEDWFQLGDADLALHVMRTNALAQGETLSAVTSRVARSFGVGLAVLPMSDEPVATIVETTQGELAFQRYFVERRCAPVVRSIRFDGADRARAAPGVVEAILRADAVLIAPSNPFLSVDPILAIADIRAALEATQAAVVSISPLVGGQAVKGPTAKLMVELGVAVENDSIARHYAGVIDGILIDDADTCGVPGVAVERAPTLMVTLEDKVAVAKAALAFARRLAE